MGSPKISVIIPAYNVERYIKQCVETVLYNSFKDFEIIVVNDGSTDGTYAILKKLVTEDERIRVFTTSNKGVSAARNFGIRQARGEYFTFVDGDDYVNEYYLEKLYQQVLDYDARLVITEHYRYQEENNMCFYSFFEPDFRIERLSQKELLGKSHSLSYTTVWAKLYHRSLFDNIRFPEGMYYEDTFVINKLYLQVPFAIHVIDNLYCYRMNDLSISGGQLTIRKIEDNVRAIEEAILDLYLTHNDSYIYVEIYKTMLYSHREYLLERGFIDEPILKRINYRLQTMNRG